MGRKQSEKRRTVRQTLAFMAAALLTLSGCAGNSGGTVYLSAVSRLKLEISGDGMVREVEALNKAGSALLGDSAFDNRTSTETLDALIPLMQTEDADTVFVDVFSDDKNWENQTVADYAERYGSDEESLAEGALQVEVRKVTDLDEVGEAVLQEETDPTEPDGETHEDLVIVPAGEETPEEDGEEGAEESTEESIEESTEESTEDSAEESQEEAEDAASARPAETTAARERETTAAARTQAAPEDGSAPGNGSSGNGSSGNSGAGNRDLRRRRQNRSHRKQRPLRTKQSRKKQLRSVLVWRGRRQKQRLRQTRPEAAEPRIRAMERSGTNP